MSDAAIAALAAAITVAYAATQTTSDVDCNQANVGTPTTDSVTLAQANLALSKYRTCMYIQAAEKAANTNLLISGVQYLAQAYFADKQYETQKQAQNRLDTIHADEKAWSDTLRGHWKDHFEQCEADFMEEVCNRAPEVVNYTAIANRVNAEVEKRFAPLYGKLDCIPIHCVGKRCSEQRRLDVEKAKLKTRIVNQEYRREEERVREENYYREEVKYKLLGLGKGYVTSSLNASRAAKSTAILSGSIDPYAPVSELVGALGQAWRNYSNTQAYAQAASAGMAEGFNPSSYERTERYDWPQGELRPVDLRSVFSSDGDSDKLNVLG